MNGEQREIPVVHFFCSLPFERQGDYLDSERVHDYDKVDKL